MKRAHNKSPIRYVPDFFMPLYMREPRLCSVLPLFSGRGILFLDLFHYHFLHVPRLIFHAGIRGL